jgi:hypothetical protein
MQDFTWTKIRRHIPFCVIYIHYLEQKMLTFIYVTEIFVALNSQSIKVNR